MKQRDIFLQSEGDAWFERNTGRTGWQFDPAVDSLLTEIRTIAPQLSAAAPARALEVGCASGARLAWLTQNLGFECCGIEPSARAVTAARARGLEVLCGTADVLPYPDASFDLVIFGFCLYLCDREDLFRIAAEADRVLRNPGWLLLQDFYDQQDSLRKYHHRTGVVSHKMDYTALFSWHPAYTVFAHRVHQHAAAGYTDDSREWVATSVLRKHLPPASEASE
jgi:SAM-dependent methyltransferase